MLFEQFFSGGGGGVVSTAQSVEVTDSAVLGGVVEVASSILAVGHNSFFKMAEGHIEFTLSVYVFICSFVCSKFVSDP